MGRCVGYLFNSALHKGDLYTCSTSLDIRSCIIMYEGQALENIHAMYHADSLYSQFFTNHSMRFVLT